MQQNIFEQNYVVIGCNVVLRVFVQRINKEKLIALNTDVMNFLTLTVKHIPCHTFEQTSFWYQAFWTLYSDASNQFSSVQSLSRVWLFATPWTAARQASLSITNSQSSPGVPGVHTSNTEHHKTGHSTVSGPCTLCHNSRWTDTVNSGIYYPWKPFLSQDG